MANNLTEFLDKQLEEERQKGLSWNYIQGAVKQLLAQPGHCVSKEDLANAMERAINFPERIKEELDARTREN